MHFLNLAIKFEFTSNKQQSRAFSLPPFYSPFLLGFDRLDFFFFLDLLSLGGKKSASFHPIQQRFSPLEVEFILGAATSPPNG